MAATLIDNQFAQAAPSTSITVTLSSAPSAGDMLIAFVGHSDNYPDVPSGWTQVVQSAITGVIRVFTKTATGSEGTSLVFTAPTTGGFTARVLRYTGLGALNAVSNGSSNGTNQINFGNVNTNVASTLIFACGLLHATTLPTGGMTFDSGFSSLSADIKTSGTGKQAQLGIATLAATNTGTYTTHAAYTPNSSTGIEGVILAFVVTSAPASTTGTMVSVTSSVGWTPTGGAMQAVLADASDTTLATSIDNPTAALIDGMLSPLAVPSGNFTVRVRAKKISATTGTLTGKLYESSTLRSTVTANLTDSFTAVDLVFPAADLTVISSASWLSGLRLTVEATATP